MTVTSRYPRLPVSVGWFFMSVWTAACLYSAYNVYLSSQDYEKDISHQLRKGFTFLGGKKDVSHSEWKTFKKVWKRCYKWFCGHILLSQLLRFYGYQWRDKVFTVYSVIALWSLTGWSAMLMMFLQCLIIFFTSLFGIIQLVWITCACLVGLLNFEFFMEFIVVQMQIGYGTRLTFFTLLISFSNLRCLSFAAERCTFYKLATDNKESDDDNSKTVSSKLKFGFMDLLTYCFYLPPAINGPPCCYRQFYTQLHKPLLPRKPGYWKNILQRTLRLLFWAVFCEVVTYIFYFSALELDTDLLQVIPKWSLAGVGFCQGQFFMVTYVVYYGTSALIASLDDIELPGYPTCISHVFRFSEMWRSFDKGLYDIMKFSIYIPLGGSKRGFLTQIMASGVCFVFIDIWHGASMHYQIWTIMNFIGITLEGIGTSISKYPGYIKFKDTWISPTVERLLEPLPLIPLTMMSYVAIFTFFGGEVVGYIYFERLLYKGFPVSFFILAVSIYCGIQGEISRKMSNLST